MHFIFYFISPISTFFSPGTCYCLGPMQPTNRYTCSFLISNVASFMHLYIFVVNSSLPFQQFSFQTSVMARGEFHLSFSSISNNPTNGYSSFISHVGPCILMFLLSFYLSNLQHFFAFFQTCYSLRQFCIVGPTDGYTCSFVHFSFFSLSTG
eukprot:TRINITY_DN20890_c0_g1_i1.p2 TRINITY_DN20890_c0_g1~~TRINITY_DN20890_c0_g1_i1.p2  ORF type:complete len:152 (-),score=10.22 TRINITY_DN20890_c0_g1_i1:273-728(-)